MLHRPNYTRYRQPMHGFTLVELLVVISIIAMLLSILMPSLQKARELAKSAICMSNVKNLVLGLNMYEMEHRTFPPVYVTDRTDEPPGGWVSVGKWFWFQYADEMVGGKSLSSNCPSSTVGASDLSNEEARVLYGNYAVNMGICRFENWDTLGNNNDEYYGKPLSSESIPRLQETLLVLDHGQYSARWENADPQRCFGANKTGFGYIPGLANEDFNIFLYNQIRASAQRDAKEGRHSNKTLNIGFCDGHVEKLKATDVVVGDDKSNRTPLWRPTSKVKITY